MKSIWNMSNLRLEVLIIKKIVWNVESKSFPFSKSIGCSLYRTQDNISYLALFENGATEISEQTVYKDVDLFEESIIRSPGKFSLEGQDIGLKYFA